MLAAAPDDAFAPPEGPLADYDRVRAVLEFITRRARRQPSLDEIAAHVGLSPSHLHHLFRRFAGLSPKAFLQAVTLDRAKALLKDSASLLDAAHELGLSGPSRLHDLFVTHEAMSPGAWKAGGAGLTLRWGFHPSPFGEALAVMTDRGLAGLGWAEGGDRAAALADMARRWPGAAFAEDRPAAAAAIERVFDPARWRPEEPLCVVLIGTDFEIRVWTTLLRIPMGRAASYGAVAAQVCSPAAARAVGAAVGRNPLSFVVPCHRVLGASGKLTGYHWGLTRKQAILGWEAGRAGGQGPPLNRCAAREG